MYVCKGQTQFLECSVNVPKCVAVRDKWKSRKKAKKTSCRFLNECHYARVRQFHNFLSNCCNIPYLQLKDFYLINGNKKSDTIKIMIFFFIGQNIRTRTVNLYPVSAFSMGLKTAVHNTMELKQIHMSQSQIQIHSHIHMCIYTHTFKKTYENNHKNLTNKVNIE